MLVTNVPPGTLEPLIRRVLAGLDPNLTINSVRTMEQQIALTFDQERAVPASPDCSEWLLCYWLPLDFMA